MEAGRYSIAMAACEYFMLSEVVILRSALGLLCVDAYSGIKNKKTTPQRIISSEEFVSLNWIQTTQHCMLSPLPLLRNILKNKYKYFN